MAKMAVTFGDWEVVALACASCGLLLRASEAATLWLDGEYAVFQGAKSRRGTHRVEVGRWTLAWLQFLGVWRALHGHRPEQPASFRGTAGLHAALRRLLDRGEGACASLRWHSFRRFGAAQLKHLGAPMAAILLYGGWASPKVAQLYTNAPSSWPFERGENMPYPKRQGKSAELELREGTTFGFYPSWIRREIIWEEQVLSEARGRRPRDIVDKAITNKRARTTSATAPQQNSSDE